MRYSMSIMVGGIFLMFSYKVMIVSCALFLIDAAVLYSFYGEEVLSNRERRVLILIEKLSAILFGILLISLAATVCQIFGWV